MLRYAPDFTLSNQSADEDLHESEAGGESSRQHDHFGSPMPRWGRGGPAADSDRPLRGTSQSL
jgi:hypothetical protein